MDTPASFSVGTLPAATLATSVSQGTPPFTVQLNSSSSGRSISVSADGVNFFPMVPQATIAGALLATFNGPVSQFLFSGATGDTYRVL